MNIIYKIINYNIYIFTFISIRKIIHRNQAGNTIIDVYGKNKIINPFVYCRQTNV